MEVLQNSYSCSAYGEDYSSLLIKDILSVRKYWCDISTQHWHSQWDIICRWALHGVITDIIIPSCLSCFLNPLLSIFVILRSFGLVLWLLQLFTEVHQPSSGEQSHPHGGAGLLHADRWIQQHSVQLLLPSTAKCQVKTFTGIILICCERAVIHHQLNKYMKTCCTDCFRQEKHLTVLVHLVSALNIFLRSAAMNCRMRVCQLGEELLPSVLYVWADMRPSAALKEEIVEFFNLQICAHHPKGAKTQDTGRGILVCSSGDSFGCPCMVDGLYCGLFVMVPKKCD